MKNKLSKRLLPLKNIQGKINLDDAIYKNNIEVGKILISDPYPFGLIKYNDIDFNKTNYFTTKNAKFKIEKPDWIKG